MGDFPPFVYFSFNFDVQIENGEGRGGGGGGGVMAENAISPAVPTMMQLLHSFCHSAHLSGINSFELKIRCVVNLGIRSMVCCFVVL